MIDIIIEAPRLISIFSQKNYQQILFIYNQNQNNKINIILKRLNLNTNNTLNDEIKISFKIFLRNLNIIKYILN